MLKNIFCIIHDSNVDLKKSSNMMVVASENLIKNYS